MRISLLLISLLAIIPLSSFTDKPVAATVFELTNTSLANISDFNGHSVSIFGVRPGMKMEEVEMAISKYDNLVLMNDKYNKDRIYLYDINKKCIAYFIWEKNDPTLNRIVLYDDIATYLKEGTPHLFGDPQSYFSKAILGKPDMSRVTLNIESIHMRQISYFYLAKHLEIIRQQYAMEEEYMLVLHEK